MAIYRSIHLSFWEDTKIYDEFTPEDKYFYLWVLTNPKTNMIGCYEISFKKAQSELGYTRDTIEMLLNRLETNHEVIKYDKKTKEVLILNWHKYNWTKSSKLDKPLKNGIDGIKSNYFKEFLIDNYNKRETIEIPYTYPIDTTVAVTDTITDSITDIVVYLNNKLNSNYRVSGTKTKDSIKARLNEGFTYEDFVTVIDKKYNEWYGSDMAKYLRPETLFSNKFESYLNQIDTKNNNTVDVFDRL